MKFVFAAYFALVGSVVLNSAYAGSQDNCATTPDDPLCFDLGFDIGKPMKKIKTERLTVEDSQQLYKEVCEELKGKFIVWEPKNVKAKLPNLDCLTTDYKMSLLKKRQLDENIDHLNRACESRKNELSEDSMGGGKIAFRCLSK